MSSDTLDRDVTSRRALLLTRDALQTIEDNGGYVYDNGDNLLGRGYIDRLMHATSLVVSDGCDAEAKKYIDAVWSEQVHLHCLLEG